MGNYCSGRSQTKAAIESCLVLNLGRLLREGNIVPGARVSGHLTWTSTETGEERGSIGFEANLSDPNNAWMRLHYSKGGAPQDYRVWLCRTPCRLGGYRWWWQCPRTGHNAAKLYLPPGAKIFASRRAFRMAYNSERGGPMDRSHNRQRRIYKKLGAVYEYYEQCPPRRPKGMHQRTYDRLIAELNAAMEHHEAVFMAGALKFLARDPTFRLDLP